MPSQPRFAMATSDAYQCVLEAFLGAGWHLEKLFVSHADWMNDHKQVIARALESGAAVQASPITRRDLADLGARDCKALVVASYQWRIPQWSPDLAYAVNFHPSPLPEGRGPYPLVRAILERRAEWGIACHRISEAFDQGDVLDAERFPMATDECHESLRLKTQMAAGRLAARIAPGLETLWRAALPQGPGSYWRLWTEAERRLDFTRPVQDIMLKIRAFGDLECIATINDTAIFVHRAKAWVEHHTARPGSVVHANGLALVVAAADGLVAITEWSFNAPGAITSNVRR